MTGAAAPRLLREALAGPELLVVPPAHDALSALIAARTGFKATLLGDGVITNTLLGLPGNGYFTLTESEFVISRVADVSPIPVMVNLHGDRGNTLNVIRAVRTLERAGAASVNVADQAGAGRAGDVIGGAGVVPVAEMVGKLKAALDARRDRDFMIVARCDAAMSEGVERVIERGKQYAEAGADAFFPIGVFSPEEYERIGREVNTPHLFVVFLHSTREHPAPALQFSDLKRYGFSAAIGSYDVARAAARGMLQYLSDLRARGVDAIADFGRDLEGTPLEDWHGFMGFGALRALEEKYLPPEELARRYRAAPPGYTAPKRK